MLLISSRASSAFFHLVKGFFSTVGVSSQLISWFIVQYLHSSDQLAKVYHEEGECRQLEFWLEKEQTLETYSAHLQKS